MAKNDIKSAVRRLWDATKEKKDFDEYYKVLREKEQLIISNWMFSNLPEGQDSFEIELDEGATYYRSPEKVRVTKVRCKKFVWDVQALKEKLNKNFFKEVVTKTYTVNNMPGLTKYLKSCGVDPITFKKFITVDAVVNEQKLSDAMEVGGITKKDIEGCYTVEVGEPYFRLSEVKEGKL